MAFNKEKAHERAERYAAKGQHDKAAREYQAIVDADPKDVRAWLMLADCLVRCGDRAAAVARYLQVAAFYSEHRQAQKALAVFRQVLNLDPGRLDVHFKCAALNMELGRIQDAIANYEQVAHAQLQSNQITDALTTYRVIADADPSAVSKRLRLAELYSRESMVADAVEAFRQAGDQLLSVGRKADYVRVAERLIYHRNDDSPTLRQLAGVYLQLGDARRALMKLNALLQINESDPQGLELLAETFMALGKPDKAVSVAAELVRQLRENGSSGRAEALRVLERGLQWDPRHGDLNRLRVELEGVPSQSYATPVDSEPAAMLDQEDVVPLDVDDADVLELDDDDVILDEDAGDVVPDERSLTDTVLSEVSEDTDAPPAADVATDFDKILFEARVYIKYRLFDHALDHVQELLDQDPRHVGALALRARALGELNRTAEAADVHVQVARLVADRDPKLAREHAQAALAVAPDNVAALALQSDLGQEVVQARSAEAGSRPQTGPLVVRQSAHDVVPVAISDELGDSGAFDLVDGEDTGAIEPGLNPDFGEESVPAIPHQDQALIDTEVMDNRFAPSEAGPLPGVAPGEVAPTEDIGAAIAAARAAGSVAELQPDDKTPASGFIPRPPPEHGAPVAPAETQYTINSAVEVDDLGEGPTGAFDLYPHGPPHDSVASTTLPGTGAPAELEAIELHSDELEIESEREPDADAEFDPSSLADLPDELDLALEERPPQRSPEELARLAREQDEHARREAEQLERRRRERERLEFERAERERLAYEEAEQTRLERERAEQAAEAARLAEVAARDVELAQVRAEAAAEAAQQAEALAEAEAANAGDVIAAARAAAEAEEAAQEAAMAGAVAEPPGGWPDISDDLAEIRFYIDQGLDDDAKAALDDLQGRHPGHPELVEIQAELGGVAEPPPPAADEGAAPLFDLEEDAEADAYLSAIFDDAEPKPAKAEKQQRVGMRADTQQADARTRFDLAMAYREMGLVDDAIKLFEEVAVDPNWQSRALVMLGTLRSHRGETQAAEDNLQEAIALASTDDERSEALYELGVLYERVGNTNAAIEQLKAVTPGFRDRDELLSQLRG